MLISLHIENIAVIKNLDLDFSDGFTSLTGETGAGKSIIIDSIGFLLGSKADKELVRYGCKNALVSGLFCDFSESIIDEIAGFGITPDEEGQIFIQRTLNQDGKSQIKINGRSVTLLILKSIAPFLINIHGQSDTASLVEIKNHIEYLDAYAKNGELLKQYSDAYSRYEAIRREMLGITSKLHERERRREMLQYQINDIEAVNLHPGEEEELVDKKVKIRNSEKISKHAEFVYRALRGSDKVNVSVLLDKSANSLMQLSEYMPECSEYADKLREFSYQITDIAEEVYSNVSDVDADPTETLNKIESRLNKITKLKRKYGLTVGDIIAFCDNAKSELEMLDNSDEVLKKLQREESEAYDAAIVIANEIHERRTNYAKQLEDNVKETLEFLDMPKVVFFASIKEERDGERKVLNKNGTDNVEFYISTNRGADPQPLSKIASGGELARIMLALKSTIADKDGVSTIVFDEIDAGVSGKTARKIGIKMLSLSKSVQLFCVTHSAQIASLADVHMFISKHDVNGETETAISVLDQEGRICELSRILGGINITDSQRAAAVDMLNERVNYI